MMKSAVITESGASNSPADVLCQGRGMGSR